MAHHGCVDGAPGRFPPVPKTKLGVRSTSMHGGRVNCIDKPLVIGSSPEYPGRFQHTTEYTANMR